MGKSKAKSPSGKKIPEGKLLKALAELEDAIEKGDALEDADPEGGLSTEGTPLSDAAPRGRGEKTKKSRAASSSAASSVEKAEDASETDDDDGDDEAAKAFSPSDSSESSDDDDDDDDEPPPFKKKGAVKKASSKTSSDDDDDEDESAEKSFRDVADGDETMSKAIEVSDFIEAMVDQLSLAMLQMAKSMRRMEERLSARLDNRVAKSVAHQQEFNTRLAKAIAAIGTAVQDDLVDMVKSLAEQPMVSPRGKAVLSKGEVNQPPWSGVNADQRMANGSDGGDFVAELSELSTDAIGDWLFKKSMSNAIDPRLIMAWEADRYNVEALPVQVRKALANDLCK